MNATRLPNEREKRPTYKPISRFRTLACGTTRGMVSKIYQGLLVTAALYILASDIWRAFPGGPGAANLELGTVAISQAVAIPE